MTCQTENLVRPTLPRASIVALAATAWLIFSIGAPESPVDEVFGHVNGKIVIRAWPICEERAYCGGKSPRRGGAELELRLDGPKGRTLTNFQCRS
jgi:hypothetical protein